MKNVNASAVDTVLGFLDCINRHDVDQLAEYMTEDHVFIDSLGHSVMGRENMRSGGCAPAAWLAIVDRGLVKQWRVYADNKPVYDILARSKSIPDP